jgi:hypothetical protein
MSNRSTESAHGESEQDEDESLEDPTVPTAVVIVVSVLGYVLCALAVIVLALAVTAAASVLGRWTGLPETHLLAALLVLLVSVVLLWQLGRLRSEVEQARRTAEWLLGEQRAEMQLWEELLRESSSRDESEFGERARRAQRRRSAR